MTRRALIFIVAGLALFALASQATASPEDFTEPEEVFTGLSEATNLEFASTGRLFIARQDGQIHTAESVDSATTTPLADMRGEVHNFWDRGMLGMAVHPEFPGKPYLYVLYTHGTPLDTSLRSYDDSCPTPPGSTADGCVVSGKLVRLQLNPAGTAVLSATVMINDWCQQFPSHSVGDLAFGADGALYVSAGDGASFNGVDYGQFGGSTGSPTPANPCNDPANEGGALRAQDLRTSGDPVTPDGAVLRINPLYDPAVPESLLALPDNPNIGHADPIGRLIVAYGLRNPFRLAFRPGTNELYMADVGWGAWEELDLHPAPGSSVHNYGWPCYEGGVTGSVKQSGYVNYDLPICEALYTAQNSNPNTVRAPLYAYHHNYAITDTNGPTSPNPADACPPATPPAPVTSSITGLAFYEGGNYPGEYLGALFGGDYSRNCIWVIFPDGTGRPDPSTIEIFHQEADLGPVDLEMGPDGNLYFVNRAKGSIGRFRWTGDNAPPVAVIDANPMAGEAPLEVTLDGSGSIDPDGHPIVEYAWDLDDNGTFETTGETVNHTFGPGSHTIRLRVTDFPGALSVPATVQINASNTAPSVEISSPTGETEWAVSDLIPFEATATDGEEGALPPERFQWDLIIHHCSSPSSCHEHHIQSWTGVKSGSFVAPDHDYPSHLELRVSAADMYGLVATDSVEINPKTVNIRFESNPSGVTVGVGFDAAPTPYEITVIAGSGLGLSAPEEHTQGGQKWSFSHWSQGGARNQNIKAPPNDTTFTVFYEPFDWFRDDDNSIFEDDIEWLAAKGITRGCNPPVNDRFCPDDHVTRGQMAAFFVRALDLPAGPGNRFDDDDGHLFEAEIDRLANSGITRGCNPPANTRFCPDDHVTRGQMAAFFVRAFGLDEGAGDNLFVDDNGHLFEAEINMLATADITRGCNPPANDRFCPESFVTRGQMAAFFHRAAEWLP